MSAHGSHLGWRSWSPDTILKVYYPRTIHAMLAILAYSRGEDFKTFFPIGSYVKTMSAEGSHLGWSGSPDTILKIDHLRTIQCHVCFKLAYWFQRKKNLNIFPIGSYVKTISADGGHLGWRSGSQDIILKVDHLRTIHAMFALN
jgi:hypothetical protein